MTPEIRACLCALYTKFDRPVDALVVDHQQRDRFAAEVRERTGIGDFSTDAIMRELLRLRKAGGLPRLRHRHATP